MIAGRAGRRRAPRVRESIAWVKQEIYNFHREFKQFYSTAMYSIKNFLKKEGSHIFLDISSSAA
jgi:hypothetical protein